MSAEPEGSAPAVGVEASPARAGGSRLRRLVPTLLVAVVPALVARLTLLTFEVESPSMEPALRVDDRLVVLADAVDPRARAPWDVAFFDRSLDPNVPADVSAVVKRVVSWGDEFVAIRDGDVWAGPDRERLSLRAKPDELVRALLVPVHGADGLVAPWGGADLQAAPPLTRLEASAGMVRFAGSVLDATRASEGVPLEGSTAVRDTALRLVVGDGDGGLVLQLRVGADTYGVDLPADGGARLHHNLGGGVVAEDPDAAPPAPGDEILFWHVDGRLRLFVAGRRVLGYDLPAGTVEPLSPYNGPSLGILDGWRELRRVEVLRDVHYTADGEHGTRPGGALTPARVPPGHVFLLGDQSQASRDSRHFGPVASTGLLGRPCLRYGPAGRRGPLDAAGVP